MFDLRGSFYIAREGWAVSRLRIIPINRIDSELLARLGHCLEERFLQEAIVENSVTIPETAINRERDQLFFSTLVSRVLNVHASADDPMLVVTAYDLYKTSQRFVFAGASDDGKIAAVSLRRLSAERESPDDANLTFQRLLKQATHALGRALGLSPCHNERCAMAQASTVYDIDAADSHLCDTCERKNRTRH